MPKRSPPSPQATPGVAPTNVSNPTMTPTPTTVSTPNYTRRPPPAITITSTPPSSLSAAFTTGRASITGFPSSPTATVEGQGIPEGDSTLGTSITISSSLSGRNFHIGTPSNPTHPTDTARNSQLSGAPSSVGRLVPAPGNRVASDEARERFREDLQDIFDGASRMLADTGSRQSTVDAWNNLLLNFVSEQGVSNALSDVWPPPARADEAAQAWAYYFAISWRRGLEAHVPGSTLLSVGPDELSVRVAEFVTSQMSGAIARFWHSAVTFKPRVGDRPPFFSGPPSGTAASFSSSQLSSPPPLQSGPIFSVPNLVFDSSQGTHTSASSTGHGDAASLTRSSDSSGRQEGGQWAAPRNWLTSSASEAPRIWLRSPARQVVAAVSNDLAVEIDERLGRATSTAFGEEVLRLSDEFVREVQVLEPNRPLEDIVGQLSHENPPPADDPTLRKRRNALRVALRMFEDGLKGVFSRLGSPAPSPSREPSTRAEVNALPPPPLTPITPHRPAPDGPLPPIRPSASSGRYRLAQVNEESEQNEEDNQEDDTGEHEGGEEYASRREGEPAEHGDIQAYLDAFSTAISENEVDLSDPARWADIYNGIIGPCLFTSSVPHVSRDPSQPGPSTSSTVSVTVEIRCSNQEHRDMGLPCAVSPVRFPFQLELSQTLRQLEEMQSSRIWRIMALIAHRAFSARHGHAANDSEASGGKGKRRA